MSAQDINTTMTEVDAIVRSASSPSEVLARFEEGKSVDVPAYLREHDNPDAAQAWIDKNEEHRDKFKSAAGSGIPRIPGSPLADNRINGPLLNYYQDGTTLLVHARSGDRTYKFVKAGGKWLRDGTVFNKTLIINMVNEQSMKFEFFSPTGHKLDTRLASTLFKFRVWTGPVQVREVAQLMNRAGIKTTDGTEHVIGTIQAEDAMDAAEKVNAAVGFKLVEGRDIPSAFRKSASDELDGLLADLEDQGRLADGCPDNLDESECKEWESNTDKYKDVVKDQHKSAASIDADLAHIEKLAEWKGWTEDMPVQVVNNDKSEEFADLAAAKKKYPELDPKKNTKQFTWAMKGTIKGKPAIRFESHAQAKSLSRGASDKQAGNEVAMTILQQMGGARRLQMMLGVKQFVTSANGVSFQFPNKERSKGNAVRITLDPDDTYTVEFFNASKAGAKIIRKLEGVYADMLVDIFEHQTGWYLRMASVNESLAAVERLAR